MKAHAATVGFGYCKFCAAEGLAVQVLETEASRNSVSVFGSLLYMGPLLEKKRSPSSVKGCQSMPTVRHLAGAGLSG